MQNTMKNGKPACVSEKPERCSDCESWRLPAVASAPVPIDETSPGQDVGEDELAPDLRAPAPGACECRKCRRDILIVH